MFLNDKIEEILMNDTKPSLGIRKLMSQDELKGEEPIASLIQLEKIEQNKKYHPEGNVLNHTFLVLDLAADIKEHAMYPKLFMWGALLHDIGKIKATRIKKGRIVAYNHEKIGGDYVKNILPWQSDIEELEYIEGIVRHHMDMLFYTKKLPFGRIKEAIHEVSLEDLAYINLCDRLGRGAYTHSEIDEIISNIEAYVSSFESDIVERNTERIKEILNNINIFVKKEINDKKILLKSSYK